jgi:N-alpha-acetyltransferase 15/16, NatA auxiliary subunit
MSQTLGSKDSSLFRQVVKHYESKQYKKGKPSSPPKAKCPHTNNHEGLKAAEQILRKNPNHGNTLAMKALIISNQGQTEEAFSLAKVALKHDMKSHVCWHVYGLLYRAEKNFDEAIKAYKYALKLEPESQPIQRDLALLQIQMRDYQGYISSRRAMLQLKPGFRQNWTALAIAHHLAGSLADAENVLTTYEETLKQPPHKSDMEHSEAALYKNTIIAESGDTEKALDHLEAVQKNNLDRLSVLELRASYLLKLDRKKEAEAAYKELLQRNAENQFYYDGLIKATGIESEGPQALKKFYDEWAEKNPRGDAARRIPLDFLEGDEFREAADKYLQRMLRKGVPSTFANMKNLYSDSTKKEIVQELVEGYASGTLQSQANGSVETKDDEKKSHSELYPLFQPFTLYFLAQHYNYHVSRDLSKAMKYIDEALSLSEKSVDFHMTKARIWKHLGDVSKAAETMDKARSLDDRDRYINSKCAKYQLRNNESDKALDTMSKFTRNETVGGPLGDLHEMQCVWYLTEDAESYARQKKLGLSLKRCHSILNIFEVWQEDQFDFHNFSLRKGMIRAYIDMVRWEDHLKDHPFYSRFSVGAINTYILLHDHPELAHGPLLNGVNGTSDDADSAERKKALKKAKKAQQKLAKAEAEKKDASAKKGTAPAKGPDGEVKKEDTDPTGKKLAETTEPLKDAMKFLAPLLEYNPTSIPAQIAGFEVFLRRRTRPPLSSSDSTNTTNRKIPTGTKMPPHPPHAVPIQPNPTHPQDPLPRRPIRAHIRHRSLSPAAP